MTTVKITELSDIGANLASSTVIPVVNMAGTPITQKTNVGNIANIILEGAGVDYPEATVALLAQTVSNAAQPNITSVGTLTNVVVSGNATVNGNITSNGIIESGTGFSTGGYLSVNGNTDLHDTTVTGNLAATGNITANNLGNTSAINLTGSNTNVLYGNGVFAAVAGGANTGNVTFDDNIIMGTGDEFGNAGLYLAPGNASIANSAVQYLRVRGGDVATHIHLDTGNNSYYDQYFGDDNKYVKLEAAGNILISSDDIAGNAAQWTFGVDGNLTFPAGDIITDSVQTVTITGAGTAAVNQTYELIETGQYIGQTDSEYYMDSPYAPDFNYKLRTGADAGGFYESADLVTWTIVAGAGGGDAPAPDGIIVPRHIALTVDSSSWIFDATGNLTLPYISNLVGNLYVTGFIDASSITLAHGAVLKDTAGDAVAFGQNAGETTQGTSAVAIGTNAGSNTQGDAAVALGAYAGSNTQGDAAVAIGIYAGQTTQGDNSVAIGYNAGETTQGENAVAVGANAGKTNQGTLAVAIGYYAGNSSQGNTAVAIGLTAGYTAQGQFAVAVGASAGESTQGNNAVAIGQYAGATVQGVEAVAIGHRAGETSQGANAVAIGHNAGQTNQGARSIILNATGSALNQTTANTFTVKPVRQANTANALYYDASTGEITYDTAGGSGNTDWANIGNINNANGPTKVAIGAYAGLTTQGAYAVAIGEYAGATSQGNNSVAIGFGAGQTGQGNNSIIINATGYGLDQTTASTFTVAPVRNDTSNISQVVFYNTTSKEVTYGNTISVAGNANVGNLGTGRVIATGNISGTQLISNIAIGTAPLVVTSTTRVANLSVDYANVADFITVAAGTGNNFMVFANAATGNVSEVTSTGITANLSTNSITATTFIGALANGNSNVNIPSANGNVNISAVGNANIVVVTGTGANIAGTLNVTGNITGNTNGFAIGYLNIPQIAAANATLALTDAGKHYYSTTAGNLTLTVPNNATTAFATGTAISIVVRAAGNILVNADTGVTLYMAGNSTAANRVVGGYGMATLMKVAADTWFINGTGVA